MAETLVYESGEREDPMALADADAGGCWQHSKADLVLLIIMSTISTIPHPSSCEEQPSMYLWFYSGRKLPSRARSLPPFAGQSLQYPQLRALLPHLGLCVC